RRHDATEGDENDADADENSGSTWDPARRLTKLLLPPAAIEHKCEDAHACVEREEESASTRAQVPSLVEEERDECRDRDEQDADDSQAGEDAPVGRDEHDAAADLPEAERHIAIAQSRDVGSLAVRFVDARAQLLRVVLAEPRVPQTDCGQRQSD